MVDKYTNFKATGSLLNMEMNFHKPRTANMWTAVPLKTVTFFWTPNLPNIKETLTEFTDLQFSILAIQRKNQDQQSSLK